MTTPKRINPEKKTPKDWQKYSTCTSAFIGTFDDLSELLVTPANNYDYAFYRTEEDEFHLLFDKWVYDEDLRQWVFLYSLRHELTDKIIAQEGKQIEDKIKEIEKRIKEVETQKASLNEKIKYLKKRLEKVGNK